jgi:hypothetical protein
MSSVGPGRHIPETKEIIHHYHAIYPSGEMNQLSDSDEDDEQGEQERSKGDKKSK